MRRSSGAVLFAASNVDIVSKIREMAIVNPEECASAAQMLVKYFDGAGLTTPRNEVLALTTSHSPTIVAAGAPPLVPSSLTTQTTQAEPRGLQMNTNISAAAQYRVKKTRGLLQAKPLRQLQEIRQKTTC